MSAILVKKGAKTPEPKPGWVVRAIEDLSKTRWRVRNDRWHPHFGAVHHCLQAVGDDHRPKELPYGFFARLCCYSECRGWLEDFEILEMDGRRLDIADMATYAKEMADIALETKKKSMEIEQESARIRREFEEREAELKLELRGKEKEIERLQAEVSRLKKRDEKEKRAEWKKQYDMQMAEEAREERAEALNRYRAIPYKDWPDFSGPSSDDYHAQYQAAADVACGRMSPSDAAWFRFQYCNK